MTQSTIVIKLAQAGQAALQERLSGEPFEYRTVPHAVLSVKGEGIVATLYKSGKLVVQGPDALSFIARYVEDDAATESLAAKPKPEPAPTVALIGSDECGKGDYFGPLIVCAVKLTPQMAELLSGGRIADSKTLSDKLIQTLAGALRERVPNAVARLDPPDYNAEHARLGNVNELLADLHAKAIQALYEPGLHVLIDRFAKESVMATRLKDLDITLEQRPRAESNLAVAAASVIARDEFLSAIAELSSEQAVELPKGAGAQVDAAGAEFARLHSFEALNKVAKVHFKNTDKVRALLK